MNDAAGPAEGATMARLAPAAPRLPAPRGTDPFLPPPGTPAGASGSSSTPGSPAGTSDATRRHVALELPAEPAGPAEPTEPTARSRRQALEQERTRRPRRSARRLRASLRILLTATAALALAAVWVAGGPSAALLAASAGLIVVGVQGLVSGQVRWAGIGGRPTAAAAAVCGLGLAATGVALAPLPLGGSTPPVQISPTRPGLPVPTPSVSHSGLRPDTDALIATAPPGTALAMLGSLPVHAEHPLTGYRPGAFRAAASTGGGCTLVQRVLLRDVQRAQTTEDDPCEVRSGVLVDPYTGLTVPYLYAQPGPEVQVDFVVRPPDAWRTGAAGWSKAERRRFASDPDNRLATAGRTVTRISHADAASWLPPAPSRRCPHVARQIAVKAAYSLWVTPQERTAMAGVLSSCRSIPGARQG
jgi:hypothetical protein